MRYVSTRGVAPTLGFTDVLLAGLASDGGLYVPDEWPELSSSVVSAAEQGYAELAIDVMWPFVAHTIDRADFDRLVHETYATFDVPEVVPIVDIGEQLHLMELFHGPTLAFKDVALQLVGRLFDHELAQRSERITIVGATSGDTGSAAIEACRDRDAIDIVVLHPAGRVSEVQRRQMTTVDSPNVHNVAIDGTFDDCQDLVKAMFADEAFRDRVRLSAVNSINWARVMAQVVYYVWAAAGLGRLDQPVAYAVPTGNFGNVFAAYGARRMGVPISQLVVGSNTNDILTRFFDTGEMEMHGVTPTLSPSMDIQVSSNLERLLFELYGRDGAAVAELVERFRDDGRVGIDPYHLGALRETWDGARLDDDATCGVMREVYERTGRIIDPHTAVGVGAAWECRRDHTVPMVVAATAHPAKFPDAVERAIGVRPALPDRLADLHDRPERYDSLPNDLTAVQAHVLARTRV